MKSMTLLMSSVRKRVIYSSGALSALLHYDTVTCKTHTELQRILAVVDSFAY